jgi:hypothetical protein
MIDCIYHASCKIFAARGGRLALGTVFVLPAGNLFAAFSNPICAVRHCAKSCQKTAPRKTGKPGILGESGDGSIARMRSEGGEPGSNLHRALVLVEGFGDM